MGAALGPARHRLRIEQHQVGSVALAQEATAAQAEQLGGLAGQAMHGLRQVEYAEIAAPVAHQVQAETGVAEEGEMGTSVAQGDVGVGVGQDLSDRLLVVVQELGHELGVEVFRERKVEDEIERLLACGRGELGEGGAFQLAVLGPRGLDDEELVPFAVEHQPAARRLDLAPDRGAPRWVAIDLLQRLVTVRRHGRLPRFHALEQVGALEGEIHAERAARGLRHQLMPARAGGIHLVERVEGGRRIGVGMEEGCDHHWTPRLDGQLLEVGDRGLAALGQHVDAATAVAHRPHQRAQFTIVGEARRHGCAALAVVRFGGRGGEAHGAGGHALAHECHHPGDLVVGGGAFGRFLAHHPGADRRMAGEAGDVGADAQPLQHVEILREALELPADAGAQRIERHALDMGEMAHGEVAVLRLAGRDGEAAVAQDCRGDPQRRRGIDERIPGDLRVVVGVAVDDAGRQGQAIGLHGLLRGSELGAAMWSNRGDSARRHAEVAAYGRRARAVEDFRVLDHQIEHLGFLLGRP